MIVEWMPAALAAREGGLPLVNIAQPFAASGMMLTCWADTGIAEPADLANRTLGVWFFGNEYPFLSWMSQLGISTDGKSETGVEVLKQGFNVDPLLQRQADCISTMTYNEYWQVIDSGVTPEELVTFKYEDQGVATLEDGLYVLEQNLEDPAFVDKMAGSSALRCAAGNGRNRTPTRRRRSCWSMTRPVPRRSSTRRA